MDDGPRVGYASFRDQTTGDSAPRIVVDVAVGSHATQVEIVVDTGGTWIVLDPEIARRADVRSSAADPQVTLVIRGVLWTGRLVRSALLLLAEKGEDLLVEGTFFVPDLEPGDEWRHPSFLGWAGGLERIWFAVDPARRRFSFAPLDQV